jgi:hypothetical protein
MQHEIQLSTTKFFIAVAKGGKLKPGSTNVSSVDFGFCAVLREHLPTIKGFRGYTQGVFGVQRQNYK